METPTTEESITIKADARLEHILTHGFSVCAGYLAMIVAQLHAQDPHNLKKKEIIAYNVGRLNFLRPFLEASEIETFEKEINKIRGSIRKKSTLNKRKRKFVLRTWR